MGLVKLVHFFKIGTGTSSLLGEYRDGRQTSDLSLNDASTSNNCTK